MANTTMHATDLQDEIGKLVQEISLTREKIKNEYVKAWLAAIIPDQNLNIEYTMKHIHLVEEWSGDRTKVSWHLEFR